MQLKDIEIGQELMYGSRDELNAGYDAWVEKPNPATC